MIATDDDPEPRTANTFVATLTALARGRLGTEDDPRFKLHGLLGIDAGLGAPVLGPEPSRLRLEIARVCE